MDARERLRRYLEQRRELGETEFVLDALSVDEALALLAGGKHIGPAREGTAAVTGRDRSAAGGGAATFPPGTPNGPPPPPPPPSGCGSETLEASPWPLPVAACSPRTWE